jgi:hypothetical protein
MKPAHLRLLLTVLLFAGWLGYLYYQVRTRPVRDDKEPLVLSRPQLLTSSVDVIATISDPAEPIKVVEVLYPAGAAPVKAGDAIRVDNIDSCGPLSSTHRDEVPPPDYSHPGTYLVPLHYHKVEGKPRFEVAPTPPSPGYPSATSLHPGPPRIYPDTPETRAEYEQIRARKPQ